MFKFLLATFVSLYSFASYAFPVHCESDDKSETLEFNINDQGVPTVSRFRKDTSGAMVNDLSAPLMDYSGSPAFWAFYAKDEMRFFSLNMIVRFNHATKTFQGYYTSGGIDSATLNPVTCTAAE